MMRYQKADTTQGFSGSAKRSWEMVVGGGTHVGERSERQYSVYATAGLTTSGIVPPAFVSGCAKSNCSVVHDIGLGVTGFSSPIREAVLQSLTAVGFEPFGHG